MKEKFTTHIGTPPVHQRLILKQNGNPICELSDDNKKLGFYSPVSGMEIHVVDTDPFSLSRNGGLTDTSLVEKYKISEEAYSNRKGTMREFIRQQKAKDPNFKVGAKASVSSSDQSTVKEAPDADSVKGIDVGMRCEVQPGARRGVVMFVGEIKEISAGGYWVGVKFDEPLGHNDGTVKGSRIFECLPGYGAFVRGHNVKVGDYPVVDIFADEDDEDVNGKERESSKAIDEEEI